MMKVQKYILPKCRKERITLLQSTKAYKRDLMRLCEKRMGISLWIWFSAMSQLSHLRQNTSFLHVSGLSKKKKKKWDKLSYCRDISQLEFLFISPSHGLQDPLENPLAILLNASHTLETLGLENMRKEVSCPFKRVAYASDFCFILIRWKWNPAFH
jgi:hypothetical protein